MELFQRFSFVDPSSHRSDLRMIVVAVMFCIVLFFGSLSSAFAQGFLLDISLPITGKSSHAISRTLDRSVQEIRRSQSLEGDAPEEGPEEGPEENTALRQPTIVLQFHVEAGQEAFGRGSSFGACYELADLLAGEKFHGIRTVAYFPQSVKGHAMLVALACEERVAAENVEIGEAGIDEQDISPTQREAYHEIAKRRNAISPAVVDKILDSRAVLLQVETEKGLRLVSPEEVEKLRETETFAEEPTELIPAGQPGIFTADSARKINLVNRIADDRVLLARGLGYRPDDLKLAPVPGELGHAVRINLNGPINNDNIGAAIRSIKAALDPQSVAAHHRQVGAAKTDFICLCIDSPGGNIEASLNLASYIVRDIDSSQVRTVAYVPTQARSDAALIAVACDEIVLGPGAILGGDGAVVFSEQRIEEARLTVRDFLSKEAVRSWSLPVALVDPEIEVFKCTRQGRPVLIDYFCDEELDTLPDVKLWKKGDTVKEKGKLFAITGGQPGEQYLVDRTAKDFAEFKFLYGLENDPLLVEPTWADQLVRALSSAGMSALILTIALFAVIVESNTPGLGIGAFVATICIILFFWLNFLGGTAGWLEVTLFISGLIFVLLEIFVLPGFGIFGLGGALLIISSLVLASQTFIIPQNSYQFGQFRNSLLILAVSGTGVFVLGGVLSRTLHKANKPKDMELIRETEKLADYDPLLGCVGLTTTPLVPAGKASFDGTPVNVVSDGDLIEKGERVEVIEVVGYRVVVRKA